MKYILTLLLITALALADEDEIDCQVYTKTVPGTDYEMTLTNKCPAGDFLATIACQVVGGYGDIESSIPSSRTGRCMFQLMENYDYNEETDETIITGYGSPRIQINCCKR